MTDHKDLIARERIIKVLTNHEKERGADSFIEGPTLRDRTGLPGLLFTKTANRLVAEMLINRVLGDHRGGLCGWMYQLPHTYRAKPSREINSIDDL